MTKKSTHKKWLHLLFGSAAILLFLYFANRPAFNEVSSFIEKNDLDAADLFYTESEKGLEAIKKLEWTGD